MADTLSALGRGDRIATVLTNGGAAQSQLSRGRVQLVSATRMESDVTLGKPDGSRSARARQIAEIFVQSRPRCPITACSRHEIWVKLSGNVAFNLNRALTRATLVEMARDPDVCGLVRNIMIEVEAVDNKLGMKLPVSIEQRMAGAEKVGEHKTSMLQDLEAGRPMELDGIAGAVVELGERLEVAMPHTRSAYACTKLLDVIARGGQK